MGILETLFVFLVVLKELEIKLQMKHALIVI